MLQMAIDRVNELIAVDMGSLVEEKGRREKVRTFLRDRGLLTQAPLAQMARGENLHRLGVHP